MRNAFLDTLIAVDFGCVMRSALTHVVRWFCAGLVRWQSDDPRCSCVTRLQIPRQCSTVTVELNRLTMRFTVMSRLQAESAVWVETVKPRNATCLVSTGRLKWWTVLRVLTERIELTSVRSMFLTTNGL